MDIKSATQLLQDESLTSVVTFHCQQAIEKLFKAILIERDMEPLRIYDLLRLYRLVLEYIGPFDDIQILKVINEAYIDARYQGELGLLPDGSPSIIEAIAFIEFAKFVYSTIKTNLGE